MTERELFERYMKQRAPGANLQRIGDKYVNMNTQWYFETWLARADMAAAGAPWVSVEERLPEDKEPILMIAVGIGPRGDYTTDQYAGWRAGDTWERWPLNEEPTHWMPLPSPPEKRVLTR